MTLKEHMNIGRRLIKLLYSLSRRYFYFLICASVVKAVTPYIPIWFSARLIDALAEGAPLATLVTYAALTVGLSTVLGVLRHWLNAQKAVGSSEVMARHEWKYAEKAMHLSYSSIEDRDVMLLSERIKDETNTGYNIFYLVSAVEMLTGSATQIIASLALTASFFASHAIPLWAKLVFVAGVAVTVTLRIFTVGKSSKLQVDYYSGCTYYNTVLTKFIDYIDDYTGGMDIRLYGMEASLAGHADGTYRELCRGEETMRIRAACLNLITTVSHYALRLGVYLILISAALGGGMTVGSIAQYVSSVMLLLTAISGIVNAVQLSLVNHGYAKRYFSYFDIPNDMYRGTLSVEKRDDDEYYIEFRDVSFKYPNTGSYALRHVSLKFRIGEKLAVVGMNGSGKTTFIKLLCRLCVNHHTAQLLVKQFSAFAFFPVRRTDIRAECCALIRLCRLVSVNILNIMRRNLSRSQRVKQTFRTSAVYHSIQATALVQCHYHLRRRRYTEQRRKRNRIVLKLGIFIISAEPHSKAVRLCDNRRYRLVHCICILVCRTDIYRAEILVTVLSYQHRHFLRRFSEIINKAHH